MRLLLCEADPLRRALHSIRGKKLSKADFSTVISDALATLPPGARHALAVELFETDACGRLVAAVAEQCAELYAVIATPQDVHESLASGGVRHRTWQRVVARVASLDPSAPETPLIANLLPGLFAAGGLSSEAEVDKVLESWLHARAEIRGGAQ